MTPPVLVDVNNDDIEDIIIPLYNSTLFAFDGRTFKQLWNRTFPSSETYRLDKKFDCMNFIINLLVRLQSGILMMMIYLILWFIIKQDQVIHYITVLKYEKKENRILHVRNFNLDNHSRWFDWYTHIE